MAVRGVAAKDISMIQEAVMALGEFKEQPDPSILYESISAMFVKYGTMDMGQIDVAEILYGDMMDVMKENKICHAARTHDAGSWADAYGGRTGRYFSGDQYGGDCGGKDERSDFSDRRLEKDIERRRKESVQIHV